MRSSRPTSAEGAVAEREPPRLLSSAAMQAARDVEMMRRALDEAERARGSTGDNPWVGCVICDEAGVVLASGHTQGPGEDHAEIVALRRIRELGLSLERATLYSTLEPCSFHGRTPACANAIVSSGVRRVVTGIRDPNPRVDGAGNQILRDGGIEVVEGVAAAEVASSLADWIRAYHPSAVGQLLSPTEPRAP